MKYFFMVSLLYSAISTAFAREIQIPEPAKAEILRINSENEAILFKDVAMGDLDSDGIDDVAVIINYKKDNIVQEKLIVLTGTKEQNYIYSEQSAAWEENMRRTTFLTIRKSSIFLAGRGSTGETYFGTEYQFKKIGNYFIMIGTTNTSGTINSDDKREENLNLLTGENVIAVIENGKREDFKGKLNGVYKIKLDEFNLDKEFDFK